MFVVARIWMDFALVKISQTVHISLQLLSAQFLYEKGGSHGIEPKRDWTHFLKIGFVVAGGGFYSYYNLQCIKLDKVKESVLFTQKTFNEVFKNGFNPVLGSIQHLPKRSHLFHITHNLYQYWNNVIFSPENDRLFVSYIKQ